MIMDQLFQFSLTLNVFTSSSTPVTFNFTFSPGWTSSVSSSYDHSCVIFTSSCRKNKSQINHNIKVTFTKQQQTNFRSLRLAISIKFNK